MIDFQVGEFHEVSCAQLRWREDNRMYFIPVLNHLHSDPQFGFPHLHYHIDGRFEIHPRMRQHFNLQDGYTSAVIIDTPKGYYAFEGIVPG
ncbi:hypothetical protein C8P68_11511 [Mucilaginibacter yixingensis]|uniref:Uncharacterized protein n=1 Tax=Mucilaginibacter yixingensis TaxID=1295612 RepID=A0A2T5J4J3_9SPHI|nr:hypothetical protein [Mucilaginibacter yixingensis]PTQ92015.1 hypothetical protein C8P68_11511 [Mucilaginibacter yixingensis]